jgi:hypothetical protein
MEKAVREGTYGTRRDFGAVGAGKFFRIWRRVERWLASLLWVEVCW